MKVNSIAGVTCHVEDLSRAAEFYESIGFRRGKEEADRITFYVNWFFVTLVAHEGTDAGAKGEGLFLYIKVDNIAAFHGAALSKGLKPAGESERGPSGNREFVLPIPMATSSCSSRRSRSTTRKITVISGDPGRRDQNA
jgi:catechol 2,3-dioxygenase-like lactoylglutathione lyase family enzyme